MQFDVYRNGKQIKVVKRSIHWLAFLAPVIWCLCHRLWWRALIIAIMAGIAGFIGEIIAVNHPELGLFVNFGAVVAISMWTAKSAPQWLREKYRIGWSHSTTYADNKLQAVELTAKALHDRKIKLYRDMEAQGIPVPSCMDRLTQPEPRFTM